MSIKHKLITGAGVGLGAFALVVSSAGLAQAVNSTGQAEGKRGGPQSSLVADGTLTKVQAKAIGAALHAAHESARRAHMDKVLGELVAAGDLTQTQADAITANSSSNEESNSHKRGMHLRDLVTAGTITRTQAEAIHESLHASKPTTAEREAQLTTVLADLVAKSTITQTQADAVKANVAAFVESKGMGFGKGGHGYGGSRAAARSAASTRA